MRRAILDIDEKTGLAEMRALVDSDDIDQMNMEMRRADPRGFTQGKTLRRVANIDGEEYQALLMKLDRDALDFEASGRRDKTALRRLLARYPQWKCSEGGV